MLNSQMIIAAAILAAVFLIFTVGKSPIFRVDRAGAAIIGATLMIAAGILTFDQAVQAVDFRTIILLFAMMIITANLKLSGFFLLAGNTILRFCRTKKNLLLAVVLCSGVLSAFFINDIVCLLFTPVVILLCRQAQVNPLPYLLGVAMASNIGSAATLIGNPQNILIGNLSQMGFLNYMAVAAPFALFGLGANYLILLWIYRAELSGSLPDYQAMGGIRHDFLIKKSLFATALILAGFILGAEPVLVASLGASWLLMTRRLKPNRVYASIDFNLLIIFCGLFVVIGGVEASGLAGWLLEHLAVDQFSGLPFFTAVTVILSNIVSNVPAVLLLKFLIPVQNPEIWWTALGIFSTIAGNLTLTGSVANLIVVEIAKGENIAVSFRDYLRAGLPLTLFLILSGLAYLYFFI